MKSDNSNDGFIELWGHDFKRVKDGLDEEQIVSFVNKLISERDTLLQRQEHLTSLSKLAERTITEADSIAKQTKDEAEEQAEAEANAIIAKAEEQAQQILEEKRAEAIATANEEAEAIKSGAQQEVELLREEETKRIQSELKSTAQQIYGELLSQIEDLKQQVTALEVNFEQILSQPIQDSTITAEEENYDITTGTDLEAGSEVSDGSPAEALEQVETMEQPDAGEAESHQMSNYQGEVEMEILPPIEMRKIMGIINYLDSLAEVRTTELIPIADKPIIKVSLRESMHLVEMLRALHEVSQATEVTEGDERRIQITLTESSVLDESKRKLNEEIFNILSQ